MPSIALEIRGLDRLSDKLLAAVPAAKAEVSGVVYRFAEEVMSISKERVPVDTGALMSTGKVTLPVVEGEEITVTLGYGDESVGYALYVHEALEGARAPSDNWSWTKKAAAGGQIAWTRPGSGPKYLENPVKENQDRLPGLVRDAIVDAFKKS